MPKYSFRKGDLVLNLLKKLKPYLIIIILIIYVEVIGNGRLLTSINQLSFYYELVNVVISRFVVGSLVGVILYILNLDDLKLTLKINIHYLIIALFFILIYCSRYISILGFQVNMSISIPYLLVASPVISYVFPVLVGYYLSKGLISTKNNSAVTTKT
ncbi:hypothetical protein [Acetobacterium bakii]|uniref:Uncharacterized protein n=1 Tax=Acetobacterium bakii TaxID=52689 RepID=A0A0L6TW53_9FIRM|nr:hypothetical protein [Acetobacterium bakii]KNZ40297.1 hypothetical protein AKG39_18395 [Acetobacterium bakii]